MPLDLLCINAGSSSLKFAVLRMQDDSETEQRLLSGEVENIGEKEGRFRLRDANGRAVADQGGEFPRHEQAAAIAFHALRQQGTQPFAGAGHRIVHGGPDLFEPQRADQTLCSRLRELVPFAPLHLPAQLAMIEEIAQQWPGLPQVLCFDTAFHRNMPELARRFPLPRRLWDRGVLRYGFHGLSYEFVVKALGEKLGRRAIIAHLGNGASMVALHNGNPIDTSMGLTPDGGFMMGTRSGDIDPGVVLYLLRLGWTEEKLARMVEHESGLAGVSGRGGDMKTLLGDRETDLHSAQAVEMFCYQIRKFIGAYAAALSGLDTLVFTGGIGENAPQIRAVVCRDLEFLGIRIAEKMNQSNAEIISDSQGSCVVRVVHTDEDAMIASHTRDILLANINKK